ncbi:TadE/TadG family type IV pilus assembly protein [Castellaniella sp.]|uniref:TadE/TadG family type IV pilus assembly protein n=1 Tax=Castellaniella sp. TaxID=1955812 RepID=UPI003C7368AE
MAGFLAVLFPILSLGLGGVELAHWMSLRQTLSLALMDAARAGSTRQASPQAIAEAFEQGLRAIYVQPAAQERALRSRRHALGLPWQIRIRQPTPAAFLDHADATLTASRPLPTPALIRNDYQAAQHARRIRQGWPQGRGPRSGLTIFEANTLLMDLWWPQAPLAPGVPAIIRALAPLHGDPTGRRMMENGYLPFRRRIRMVMQSHPAPWPDLPDGRVVHDAAAHPGPAFPEAPGSTPADGADTNPHRPISGETAPATGQDAPRGVDTSETDMDMEAPDISIPGQEAAGDMPETCAP